MDPVSIITTNATSLIKNVTKVENITNLTTNVSSKANASNVTSAVIKTVSKANPINPAMYHMYVQLTWLLGLTVIVMLFLLWRYYMLTKGRQKKLLKENYGWVHFFLKSGKLKTYLMQLHPRFNIPELGTYFCDSSADVVEYKTGIRHRFFFEGSPFQIKFIPTGVNFTVPDDLDPSLKALFESKAPKVIQLKSNLTSELFDKYLRLAARYGNVIRNVGRFKLSKETAIAIILIGIGAVIVLKMLLTKSP